MPLSQADQLILDQLEPQVAEYPLHLAAPLSTAISFKRIADFLAGTPRNEDVVQYVMRELNIRR